jgi:hypothetical protein
MIRPVLGLAVLAVALVAAASAIGSRAETPLTGSVVRTYSLGQCDQGRACFTCNGPVDLDLVAITVDTTANTVDAIKLADGCTGRIKKIAVLTQSGDGVKVSSGAADVTVAGGTITCTDRAGAVHQDAIQAMGGTGIVFKRVTVTCPTANHSAFFVNRGGIGDETPTRVLFRNGYLGSTGTTADIGTSKRSGVSDSVVCPSLRLGKPISFPDPPSGGGPAAVQPVNEGNTFPATC